MVTIIAIIGIISAINFYIATRPLKYRIVELKRDNGKFYYRIEESRLSILWSYACFDYVDFGGETLRLRMRDKFIWDKKHFKSTTDVDFHRLEDAKNALILLETNAKQNNRYNNVVIDTYKIDDIVGIVHFNIFCYGVPTTDGMIMIAYNETDAKNIFSAENEKEISQQKKLKEISNNRKYRKVVD